MWVHVAPPLAALLIPWALGRRHGAKIAAVALLVLCGGSAFVAPGAALITAGCAAAAGALATLARALGARPHAALCLTGMVASAFFGSLFLLGPLIESALERGARYESIRPAIEAVLDTHPYPAVETLRGVPVLQRGFLYESVGAFRLEPPDPRRGVRHLAVFAAACAIPALLVALLKRRRAG